jgi:two-component system phosphate regulon sensor histidine kinase PhoR
MKNKHLGRIILFGTLVLTCLLILQVYWFKKAFNVEEMQFDHSVQIALKKVADSVSSDSEVKKLSSNFFFVATESELNDKDLDNLLKKEFLIRGLNMDYELGVYNADDDTLVYGNYVRATQRPITKENFSSEQKSDDEKNFAVYFPKKGSYVAAQLDVWIFSTFILLLMMGFFAYAMYSLLRERRFASLKNDFINNMTHEFKTPVTNIKIAGEILKNRMADQAGMKVYIDILLKENEKLRQKIDQVLLGSSFDHLKRPALKIVDVHELITDCAEAFQLKVQERDGNIRLEFNAENTSILADKDLLTQAINNVIDNAEKYSPHQPCIVVRTKDCEHGIEIDIIDEGIGIAPNMKSKVFEKFFRIRSGDVHNVKGFGLGLSFVKNVIRSHRGQVSLFSELNKGTEVKIILPNA